MENLGNSRQSVNSRMNDITTPVQAVRD